ncbi:MAG: hypothetical protein E7632_12640 [Ruminococcaceae bacterium]|nr:hypothetical protein [Oscillospiraceae bacterium]
MRIKKILILLAALALVCTVSAACGSYDGIDEELPITPTPAIMETEIDGQRDDTFRWYRLDTVNTYTGFRSKADAVLGIETVFDPTADRNSKNGCLFVTKIDGRDIHTGNPSLYDAFRNRTFVEEYWQNSDVRAALAELAPMAYPDVSPDDPYALYAALNAYYNLLRRYESPEAFHASAGITRQEFCELLEKVSAPADSKADDVGDKAARLGFLSGASYDLAAQEGNISRIEAIYLAIRYYFGNSSAKSIPVSMPDAANAGDLAMKLGFKIQHFDGSVTEKTYWQQYTLTFMLEHPYVGLQEELYEALAFAAELGLVDGDATRWQDALNRGEALELVTNAFLALNVREGYLTEAAKGEFDSSKQWKTMSLDTMSEVHRELFAGLVKREDPVSRIRAYILDGRSDAIMKRYLLEEFPDMAKIFTKDELMPKNAPEVFLEWFKTTDDFRKIQEMLDDREAVRNAEGGGV